MQVIIDKYGTSLGVHEGLFHLSHPDGSKDIPADKVSSILVTRSAKISTDAILLAVKHNIEISILERGGFPAARIWSGKYGSISTIRKNQLEFCRSGDAVTWIIETLVKKFRNQQAVLLSLYYSAFYDEPAVKKAEEFLENKINQMEAVKAEKIDDIAASLRGLEGSASKLYFRAISHCLPDQYQFEERSQHPALDMFNSLLNYGYGILYNLIEGALLLAGVDPYIGILHRDDYNRPSMVFDFIEPFRVWVDYTVVNLCIQEVIFKEFFDIENHAWYLNSQGRRILIKSFNDYLDEIVIMNKLERSRRVHISLAAQEFATKMKKFKSGK